jgi:sugar transferase (PEP-CTERM system associated)
MPSLLEQIIPRRKLLLITSETVIYSGILLLGTSLPPLALHGYSLATDQALGRGILSCLTVAILCQASLSYNDLYDWKVSQNRAELGNRLVHSLGYSLMMLAILVFLMPQLFHFPGIGNLQSETWKLIVLLSLSFAVVWAWRAGFHWFFYKWNFGESVLILGTGEQARNIAGLIHDNPISGFEAVGLVGKGETDAAAPRHLSIVGQEADLPQLARDAGVARVVAAYEERRGALPVPELLRCRMDGVLAEEREVMYERVTGKISVESLRPSYLIYGPGFSQPPLAVAIKRTVDILASMTGLILSSPVCVLAALLILLDSRGPLLFRQERVGQDGRVFKIIKFRTMQQNAEAVTGPVWATTNDARVTRVGRLLRLLRVDEIPQMLNVLAGHMSFIGPRPERPFFVEELARANPFYALRHTVKPGLSGWAQVRHPYGASVEDALEKLRYDLYYLKTMSLVFDLNIIMRTVGVVLFGKGAR